MKHGNPQALAGQLATMVGSSGQIQVPLYDGSTGGLPEMRIGPGQTWHNGWYVARLPGPSDLSSILVPAGYDSREPRFDLRLLVALSPLPDYVTMRIERAHCKGHGITVSPIEARLWTSRKEVPHAQSASLAAPILHPGQLVEFNVTTRLFRSTGRRMPPLVTQLCIPIQLALLIECRWLREVAPPPVYAVNGNPFDSPAPPVPLGPYVPDNGP